ncbi:MULTISPECIES: hypothetical protein [unclassified Sphingomonas]|uniref:hypothetical protein n=1 Tax=unclassified Sphingomonas TaxID=196159 RepID=UPI0022698D62|nr:MULTISPECIES: hypothetical protein [unclassified Sphingomonas]
MTLQVAIMAAVAAAFTLAGAWLLLELRHPQAPARVYVYRMVGIMAVAAGVVLGFSAAALQQWSAPS